MATKKRALGDDPLFTAPKQAETLEVENHDFSDIVTEEKLQEVKKTISDIKHEVKKLEQRKRNREDDYIRMTFIVNKDLLETLKNYCYTERISQKEGLERALLAFLDDKTDLVVRPPKNTKK